jgi:hypothetical protein
MEGLEDPLLVGLRDAHALVLHGEHGLIVLVAKGELHRFSGPGILHTIGQQVGEDVAEQPLVGLRVAGKGAGAKFNRALSVGDRMQLVGQTLAECDQVEWRRLALHFASLNATEHQHLFHHASHALDGFMDGLQMIPPLFGLEPFEITIEDFRRGHDDSERGPEFM